MNYVAKTMKILIITTFFPPQNSIASLRPYSWAKYWSRAGHDVTVLTQPKRITSANSPMPIEGFKVREIPIPGIQFMRFLAGSEFKESNLIRSVDFKNKPKSVLHIKLLMRSVMSYFQQRYGIFYGVRMPDPIGFWGSAAYRAVCNESWDLVVSTATPYYVHTPAYRLLKAGLTKIWIADWRDLWTDNHIYPGLPLFRNIERWLERRWCRAADRITTVSEPLAEILRNKFGDKVTVIYNGFDPEDYENLPAESAFPDDGVFRIVYTGTIYKGKRDPTLLFSTVKQLDILGKLTPANLQILFLGKNIDVKDLATTYGVSEYVQYLGLVPRMRALHMQRDAHALLLLEFESEIVKGILTGKLFEYLYAGPPIIAIGIGADSSVGTVLEETGRGVAYGHDQELLTSVLVKYMEDVNKDTYKIGSNLSRIAKYTRETQAKALLGLCDVETGR